MAESRREEWAARVQRWKESGLTATEFAAEMGLNPRTLSYWKWRLGREARSGSASAQPRSGSRSRQRSLPPSSRPIEVVEVASRATEQPAAARETGFELQTGDGRWRLRVPANFDPQELGRLMTLMEGKR
jgi:hypothetical protein